MQAVVGKCYKGNHAQIEQCLEQKSQKKDAISCYKETRWFIAFIPYIDTATEYHGERYNLNAAILEEPVVKQEGVDKQGGYG